MPLTRKIRWRLIKAIQNLCKGKTVIVVAHRLSALENVATGWLWWKIIQLPALAPMRKFVRTTPTIEMRGKTTKQPGILLISWREASSMSEHDVLKRTVIFILALVGLFWKGFSPAACLCCFTLSCSFCGRDNLT